MSKAMYLCTLPRKKDRAPLKGANFECHNVDVLISN